MSNAKTTLKNEIRLIPWWAYLLAVIVFIGFQVILGFAWRHTPNPPPLPFQIFIRIVPGIIVGFLVLLIGYVNQDAKLRNMNRTLWTLLVIFIPNAIGFILYFLLRQPRSIACPQCGTLMNPKFNFCSNCKFSLHPICPNCQRAVDPGDKFCPHCSHELVSEAARINS
jgi:RNA polymerase subunit RPABC4/transcription elongation factor Spt4